jgi:NADH:ubiquinone oxidoreductase subunit 4 (subunit M)
MNRILFGNMKNFSIAGFKDLTRQEFFTLLPFVGLTFLLGMYPEVITSYMTVY